MMNCKVILTGQFGVGKTSLFNRFLYEKFDDRYLTTIGVKVDKKRVNVDNKQVNIMLWDIAGEVKQDKVPINYFLGTSVIIYVFDLTRPMTWQGLDADIAYLKEKVPNCLIKIVGNKKDLLRQDTLSTILTDINQEVLLTTSAKTGENIDNLFQQIAKEVITAYELS